MSDEQRRKSSAARRALGVGIGLLPALGVFGSAENGELRQCGHSELGGTDRELAPNGAASGEHFDLTLVGTSTASKPNVVTGGRVVVSLDGSTHIGLAEGEFAVLDGDGTDGAAQFQLPASSSNGDGVANYSVFARALGKGAGAARLTTCTTDPATGEALCSTESLLLVRSGEGQRCDDVSKDLLFVEADSDGDGDTERIRAFDESLRDVIWRFDENGRRVLQLRFYRLE
jgi:hypothetical protein